MGGVGRDESTSRCRSAGCISAALCISAPTARFTSSCVKTAPFSGIVNPSSGGCDDSGGGASGGASSGGGGGEGGSCSCVATCCGDGIGDGRAVTGEVVRGE